jgi:hypothetical protein
MLLSALKYIWACEVEKAHAKLKLGIDGSWMSKWAISPLLTEKTTTWSIVDGGVTIVLLVVEAQDYCVFVKRSLKTKFIDDEGPEVSFVKVWIRMNSHVDIFPVLRAVSAFVCPDTFVFYRRSKDLNMVNMPTGNKSMQALFS